MVMDSLDDNLLGETLIKLPAKTLGQLKVINKRWYSLISHPFFVNKHTTLQTNSHHVSSFFPNFPMGGGNIVELSFDESLPTFVNETTISLDLPEEFAKSTTVISANSNGLLLIELQNYICIFNPLTKKKHLIPSLPSASEQLFCRYGIVFGGSTSSAPYDYNNHYNVVCLVEAQTAFKFKIFMPEQGCWRDSNKSTMIRYGGNCGLNEYSLYTSSSPVCFRGSIHWLTREGYIIAFKLDKEENRMIEIPKSVSEMVNKPINDRSWWECSWFGVVEDEVSLVVVTTRFEIILWVLHDYENNKWEIKRKDVMKMERYIAVVGIQPIFYNGEILVSELETVRWSRMSHFYWHKYNIRTGDSPIPLLSCRDCGRWFPNISTLTEVILGSNQV